MDFQQLPPMTEEQRQQVWAQCMREISTKKIPTSLSKAEWKEAVDAVDDWISQHMLEVNNSLPEKIRDGLTMQQKAIVFFNVVHAKLGGF